MSEYFIGTDIVSVSRIEKILQQYSDRFKKHVFTDKEKSYCDLKSNPAIHYAGRFAAKEAVKKALYSSSIINSINFADIDITPSASGFPQVKLSNTDLNNVLVKISISHTDEFATAFALITLS